MNSILENTLLTALIIIGVIVVLVVVVVLSWYKKVPQGKAMIRTGMRGTSVSFDGILAIPVLERLEIMEISLKKLEIHRTGKDGLICKDNMRADIKVAFFVRVNKEKDDVKKVAQTIGPARSSKQETLVQLFDAKFSEALKTVGKQFNFVELYDQRERFKQEIINTIGRDLNGYVLDDAAIDYLEQTPIEFLDEQNILDVEGIKKIAELTAQQHILSNKIRREEERVIKKQDVETQETILELERQLAEKEQIQKREVASITAREEAETMKIQQEEKLRSQQAKIATDEELAIAEENKLRQIIVASKAKEKTEKVETERVEKERELELNEREKVVTLAQIEKEKAVEIEKKNIQDVIRERVIVEKAVVVEEQKILDTKEFATADREKQVAITNAERTAQEKLISEVQGAEAEKQAAGLHAEKRIIEADTELKAAEKEAEAKIKMAEARAAEEAALGMSEAQVMEAKARAREIEGETEANVKTKLATATAAEIRLKAEAEAEGVSMMAGAEETQGIKEANVMKQKAMAEAEGKTALAVATEKQGLAEAKVIEEKLLADAKGIAEKADSMKKLNDAGKEHEEFKIRIKAQTDVKLAQIQIQEAIAQAQAQVLGEALKSANIDIVGGESTFFDKIIQGITQGKYVDYTVENSDVLGELKTNLLNGEGGGNVIEKLKGMVASLGLSSDDVKNLSIAALILKLSDQTSDEGIKGTLSSLLDTAMKTGFAEKPASILGLS